MKVFTGLLAFLIFEAILGETDPDWDPDPLGDPTLAANVYFAVSLYDEFSNNTDDFVISPLGVSAALGTLLFAVGPRSSAEIDLFLYPENANSSELAPRPEILPFQKSQLIMATVALVRKGIYVDPKFVKQAQELDADVYRTNFSPSDLDGFNKFLQEKTNQRRELAIDGLSDLDFSSISLLFYNGVKLKARLEQSFLIIRPPLAAYPVLVAPQAEALHGYIPDMQSRVLGLPLRDNNAFLLILLPDRGVELWVVEIKLRMVDVRKLPQKLNTTRMNITLPTIFDAKSVFLAESMHEKGIRTVFDENDSDLAAFGQKVHLHDVLVYTQFDLSEEGINWDSENITRKEDFVPTETDSGSGIPGTPLEFKADRPIIYAVVDSQNVFVMGRYTPRLRK